MRQETRDEREREREREIKNDFEKASRPCQ